KTTPVPHGCSREVGHAVGSSPPAPHTTSAPRSAKIRCTPAPDRRSDPGLRERFTNKEDESQSWALGAAIFSVCFRLFSAHFSAPVGWRIANSGWRLVSEIQRQSPSPPSEGG